MSTPAGRPWVTSPTSWDRWRGAYASFEEGCKGTLDAGMLADLQVYRGDPLEDGAEVRWEELRPSAVLLGGAKVFGTL